MPPSARLLADTAPAPHPHDEREQRRRDVLVLLLVLVGMVACSGQNRAVMNGETLPAQGR